MRDLIYVPTVSIKPTHLTFYYQCQNPPGKRGRESVQVIQPKSNKSGAELSDKGRKRLVNSINWLHELAEKKRVFNNKTKSYFNFKVNFITLTLPALQAHKDTTIKTVCFNNFLTELRKYHGLENYVWRAECQSNGNIHFHLATDTYFHWGVLRRIWNRLLKKLGYIERYRDKFSGLSFKEYCDLVDKEGKQDLSKLLTRYQYGEKTNWSDPNTTDIHSLKKVRNTAAYMAKYMAKKAKANDETDDKELKERRICGRTWGRSQSLSKCNSIILDVCNEVEEILDYVGQAVKPKWIVDKYFSVCLVSMGRYRVKFSSFINPLIEKLKREIDFCPGGLAKSVNLN